MTHGQEDERTLVDTAAFSAMASECGWSVPEFVSFYADGSRKELAGLAAAVASGDLAEVARLAHGARGSSAAACVPVMAEAFYQLEEAAARDAGDDAAATLARAGTLLEVVIAFLTRTLGSTQSPS